MNATIHDEHRGRCMVASADVKIGQVVSAEVPFVYVPQQWKRKSHCSHCLKPIEQSQYAYYCSNDCYKKDWKRYHSKECKAIQLHTKRSEKWDAEKHLTESIRLMAQLLYMMEKNNEKKEQFKALVEHREKLPNEELETLTRAAMVTYNFAQSVFQGEDLPFTPKDVLDYYCKFKCNSYYICDEEMNSVGSGIYLNHSLYNHSCKPNCVIIYQGLKQYIKCIEPVQSGTELTVSYIELVASTDRRKTRLLNTYQFECTCPRCVDRTGDDQLLTELQPIPTIKKLYTQIKQAQDAIAHDDYTQAFQIYDKLYNTYKNQLGPQHEIMIQTCDALSHMYVQLQEFDKAIPFVLASIPGFELCYPKYSPVLGLQYAMIGKLYWYKEQSSLAYDYLKKAYQILQVTHGHASYSVLGQIKDLCMQAQLAVNSNR